MAQAQTGSLVIDSHWDRGIIRDAARDAIPEGGVYNAIDYLVHRPGVAQKRGGSAYAGPALSGASYAAAVAWAEFTTGGKLLAVGENNHLFTVTAGTTTDQGAIGFVTVDRPKFRVGASKELLVFTAPDGTTAPKTWNGTTIAALGGSPPTAKYAAVYKTRLCLGNTHDNPDRIYFSDVPDIESTWDTSDSWIDTDYPITGLASLQNALVIFSARKMQRITGTTPPPGTDFDRAPIGEVGCTDARSIVTYENRVIFANQRGVFRTDGSINPECLTRLGGVETLWRGFFDDDVPPTTIAAGLLGSYLIVTVLDPSRVLVGALACYLPTNSWTQLSNIKAIMLASSIGLADECYYADVSTNRVVALSGLGHPSEDNMEDADGTPVEPVLEGRVCAAGPTLKHFKFGHLSLDMRDGGDAPTMTVEIAPGLEASTFAEVAESPLPATSDEQRFRVALGKKSQGLTWRLTQVNASSKTEVYAVETDARGLPVMRGGQ